MERGLGCLTTLFDWHNLCVMGWVGLKVLERVDVRIIQAPSQNSLGETEHNITGNATENLIIKEIPLNTTSTYYVL